MRALLSVSEMLKAEEATLKKDCITAETLMQRVANGAAQFLDKEFPDSKFVFLCGPGNNGGDGYETVRLLNRNEKRAWAFSVMDPQSTLARKMQRALPRSSILKELPPLKRSETWVVVDAVFGLQGRAELKREWAALFRRLHAEDVTRIAFDVPSGVNLETGDVHPDAFRADYTLAVGYPKQGFLWPDIAERIGEVVVLPAGFKSTFSHSSIFKFIESSDFSIPLRAPRAHKKHAGSVGILMAADGAPGATWMAGEAAARAGVGYVHVWSEKKQPVFKREIAPLILKSSFSAKEPLQDRVLVLGCGGRPRFRLPSKGWKSSAVIDASSLSKATSKDISEWRKLPPRILLTPHPGEAAALLKTSVKTIEKDRVRALHELVDRTQQSVYLKGAPGLLCFSPQIDRERIIYTTLDVNPALATAGSGDVLSGLFAACIAQLPDERWKEACFSALLLQKALSHFLRSKEGSWASDQLALFESAFQWMRSRQ